MSQETPVDAMYWLRVFRHRIINLLLGSVTLLATVGMVFILRPFIPYGGRISAYLLAYVVAYLVILVLFFVRRIPDRWRALGFLTLLYGFSVFSFVSGWLGSSARTFLLSLIILATILVGPQTGWIAAIASLATYAAFGVIYSQSWLTYGPASVFSDPSVIIMEGIGFGMAVGMTSLGLWFFRVALTAANRASLEAQQARTLLAEHAQQLDRANQLLAERTNRLEAANKELESFSYSVSHDLRAPLRAMDGFSRILLEDHASQLSPEVQQYLDKVLNNAQRMRQLIEGLLRFSRLGRQALRKQRVESTDLVRQVLEELDDERVGRDVEISVGELPPCEADPTLLKQVYANLLSNALKYTRGREVAHIEVGHEERDGELVYYVRDNGVGFDMQYADKLFGVFQRLHGDEEYEGTGVGLAIVQRIVHRHGGRVWAQAGVDQGATFYFTLGSGD